ncbi:hypothetical protein ACF08M_20580 [Streptomyces sp. NPDC015032]|uniref:hypothetical protein n=1 Tax=Streptomyces sp. NPDC015032 TaxID=3364937 RepID=UPI0036F68208
MRTYRIGDAAALPGVGSDTVRRLVDGGKRVETTVGREPAEEPGPEPGVPAIAVIKSTDVVADRP